MTEFSEIIEQLLEVNDLTEASMLVDMDEGDLTYDDFKLLKVALKKQDVYFIDKLIDRPEYRSLSAEVPSFIVKECLEKCYMDVLPSYLNPTMFYEPTIKDLITVCRYGDKDSFKFLFDRSSASMNHAFAAFYHNALGAGNGSVSDYLKNVYGDVISTVNSILQEGVSPDGYIRYYSPMKEEEEDSAEIDGLATKNYVSSESSDASVAF